MVVPIRDAALAGPQELRRRPTSGGQRQKRVGCCSIRVVCQMRSHEPHILSEFGIERDWYPEMVNKWVMKPAWATELSLHNRYDPR
jgi:hypothetical protein